MTTGAEQYSAVMTENNICTTYLEHISQLLLGVAYHLCKPLKRPLRNTWGIRSEYCADVNRRPWTCTTRRD